MKPRQKPADAPLERPLNNNGTLCSMAWNHQFIDPSGRVKPCCRYHERTSEYLNQKSLRDIFSGEEMRRLRSDMLTGVRVPGCIRCYEEQDGGKASLRERYNKGSLGLASIDINSPAIRWLELAISNECNLACRMCDSKYSWRWIKEEELLGYPVGKKTEQDIRDVYGHIPTLRHLKITGGEPFLTPQVRQLLSFIVKNGYAKNMYLNLTTNCTVVPSDEMVALLNQFQKIELLASWDSANKEEAEYIRYPGKFEHLERTTIRLMKLHEKIANFELMWRPSISIHNIYFLKETIDWWLENTRKYYTTADRGMWAVNPTHVTFPRRLALPVLPERIRDRISRKLEDGIEKYKGTGIGESLDYLIHFMYSRKFDIELLRELRHYNLTLDKSRGQDFFQSFPHFKDIFDDLGPARSKG